MTTRSPSYRWTALALAGAALIAALPGAAPAGLRAGADSFTIVNHSGLDLADLQLRRSGGGAWRALGLNVAKDASQPVPFADPDCAFDLQAATSAGPVTWSGVNLCDVDAVILNRRGATPWVDYQ